MKKLSKKHYNEIIYNFYDYFKRIQNLNRGGCGIFAKLLFERFIEIGYEPKFVLHLTDKTDSASNAIIAQMERVGNASCYSFDLCNIRWFHISVRVGNINVDANGIYEPSENMQFAFISKETLETMLTEQDYWNHSFDYKNSPQQIKYALQKAFV